MIYSCEDDKNIVLNSSDDRIIPVNPYENFIDFFNNYRNDFKNFSYFDHHMYYGIASKKYLKNCISENGDNYLDEYKKYHWDFKLKIENYKFNY